MFVRRIAEPFFDGSNRWKADLAKEPASDIEPVMDLVLVGGFSQSLLDMLSGVSPEEAGLAKLSDPRYDCVSASLFPA